MLSGFNPELIQDLEGAQQAIVVLLNLVEELKSENQTLREEVQSLRDEVNRLKGEQGKPNKPASAKSNHSSEAERRERKAWRKQRKVERIQIDREETLRVDRGQLPADAVFKGYKTVVVQDVRTRRQLLCLHPGPGLSHLLPTQSG